MVARLRTTKWLPAWPAATWLAWLLPVFAWAPLTYPGYFAFHSGFLPIFNLTDLAQHGLSLTWAPTVGQAYDLLRGDGRLPYFLALLLRGLGLPAMVAVKGVLGLALVAGGLGVYGWVRRLRAAADPAPATWAALVAGLVYVLWPLGLATVYVRGAIADAAFLALAPFAWWAATAALDGDRRASAGLALALAAALWAQAGLALWLAALLVLYLLLAGRRRAQTRAPALAGWAGGLALGALGLLPLLLARGWGGPGYVNFADHFVYLNQLLQPGWGAGLSIPGPYDTLTFQLGLAACALAAVALALPQSAEQPQAAPEQDVQDSTGLTGFPNMKNPVHPGHPVHPVTLNTGPTTPSVTRWLPALLIAIPVLLSLTIAAPLWSLLPWLSHTLTYPWQLLLLAGPWLAWLAGLGARKLAGLVAADAATVDHAPTDASTAKREDETQQSAAILPALFACLLALVVLGSYGYLNPLSTPETVPDSPAAILGDNQVALLSAQPGAVAASGQVTVTVRWQGLRPLDQDYTVFFQALGPDGQVWGQADTMPQDGKLPTGKWQPGQVIDDRYHLGLKPGAPAELHYILGMYQWQTGQRLTVATPSSPAAGNSDHVTLAGR